MYWGAVTGLDDVKTCSFSIFILGSKSSLLVALKASKSTDNLPKPYQILTPLNEWEKHPWLQEGEGEGERGCVCNETVVRSHLHEII